MTKTFNLYCDESCHLENDLKRPFMLLSYVSCPLNKLKEHATNLKEFKLKHNFFAEIKWTSASKSKLDFYFELVDYFFASDLKFRCILVDKRDYNKERYPSFDDFYYRMYYFLLNHNIDVFQKYHVYLDVKDTLSGRKIATLKEILNAKFGVFGNVQTILSKESIFMQVADMLMGAVSYENNDLLKENQAKLKIIERIKLMSNSDLKTTNFSEKFNLFSINLSNHAIKPKQDL